MCTYNVVPERHGVEGGQRRPLHAAGQRLDR